MRRNVISGVFVLGVLSFIFGCQQKPQGAGAMPQLKEEAAPAPQPQAVSPQFPQSASAQMPEAVSAPIAETQTAEAPQEYSAPAAEQIQQALKNAGFYDGEIDGKIGPRTKKAIEGFQAQNNLKVDAKVGPQTWGRLKEYLNAAVPVVTDEIQN